MNDGDCLNFLCKEKILSASEWKKKTLAKKIELRNSGIVDFEHHPEYIKITNCKPDDDYYPSKEYCKNNFGYGSNTRQKSNPNKKPTQRAPTSNKVRCPNGTRRNKKTRMCEPKNKQGSPKRPTPREKPAPQKRPTPREKPATAKKRCQNGMRRNKKTGNCEAKI